MLVDLIVIASMCVRCATPSRLAVAVAFEDGMLLVWAEN